jgi:Flp pilus assembly protein TadG
MKRKIKNQRGVAAVEFALVLIPLILLVFGTIEFSTLLYDKAVITNASREGARAGIVFVDDGGVGAGEIANVVSTYCGNHLISLGGNSGVTTTVTDQGVPPNRTRTVRVQYQYNFLVLPNIITSLSDGITLEGTTVMRMEDQRELGG